VAFCCVLRGNVRLFLSVPALEAGRKSVFDRRCHYAKPALWLFSWQRYQKALYQAGAIVYP